MKGDKPFPRIVVPLDGSHLSESAAHAAAALARRVGVPLTLFSATPSEEDRDELNSALGEMIARLRNHLVVDVIIDVVGPSATHGPDVADAILEEADVDGALVCIASHGRSGLGAAVLGSTTEQILRKSSQPVLVVGPKFEPRPWRDDGVVVACVDGSLFSEHAVPVAVEWSATFSAPLWLVQIAAPVVAQPDLAGRGDVNEFAYLRHLAERSGNANFDVLHNRHPATELADLAGRWPINLMVMATHGRSGWSRLTLGSVAMSVVHHATFPVLLARAADHAGTVEDVEPANRAR